MEGEKTSIELTTRTREADRALNSHSTIAEAHPVHPPRLPPCSLLTIVVIRDPSVQATHLQA